MAVKKSNQSLQDERNNDAVMKMTRSQTKLRTVDAMHQLQFADSGEFGRREGRNKEMEI